MTRRTLANLRARLWDCTVAARLTWELGRSRRGSEPKKHNSHCRKRLLSAPPPDLFAFVRVSRESLPVTHISGSQLKAPVCETAVGKGLLLNERAWAAGTVGCRAHNTTVYLRDRWNNSRYAGPNSNQPCMVKFTINPAVPDQSAGWDLQSSGLCLSKG